MHEEKRKIIVVAFFLLSIMVTAGCIETEKSETIKTITADFTFSPSNPTTNDIIHFYDKSKSEEGNITSWYWEFDVTKQYTDDTSTLQNPTYRYEFGYGKTFKVKLTVTDDKGNSDSVIKDITIVHQSYIPQGDDITLEILKHERKNYDLDGFEEQDKNWTFVWLTIKLTNNWNKDIIPSWALTTDGYKPYWEKHFFIYTKHQQDPSWAEPEEWVCTHISPQYTPEKIAPGESFTWTATFWIQIKDIYYEELGENEEYKLVFKYYYDATSIYDAKEVTFSTYI